MPVTDVTHDLDTRTLTITAGFAAPVERIWQVYADPRQLEQVFGPPTYPATFVDHDLTPGSRSTYFMTSPEGERYFGWWQVTAVDEPRSFAVDDGFAIDDTFAPNTELPVSKNTFTFTPTATGTRFVSTSTYDSVEALEKVLEMGVVEGATLAMNQIDVLIA